MSSDFGVVLRRGIDLQIGDSPPGQREGRQTPRLIHCPLADLLRQRIFQTASGYADGNDANAMRPDPLFKLAGGRAPLDWGNDLASGPSLSRLENSVSRKNTYRLAKRFVDAFIARYAQVPAAIVLDLDHSENATHGQQELAFYNPTMAITAPCRCFSSKGSPES